MTNLYMILEGGQPMDGKAFTHAEVLRNVQFADADAVVVEFDLSALKDPSQLSTSMRNVTEDIVCEAWHGDNVDRPQRARQGLVGMFIDIPDEEAA